MFHFEALGKAEFVLYSFLFIGLFATLALAFWAYRKTPNLALIDSQDNELVTKTLWKLRKVFFGIGILGLVSLLGVMVAAGAMRINPLLCALFPFLNLLVMGHVQFSTEKMVRKLELKWFHGVLIPLRSLGAFFLFQGLYFAISMGLMSCSDPIMRWIGIHPLTRQKSQGPLMFVFIVISISLLVYFSSVMIRLMLPSKRLKDAGTEKLLRDIFEDAKIKSPRFFTLEMDKMKSFNAGSDC